MIRLTWAQMRRSVGRLAAAAVAIVVGTAFVTATLLAGALIEDATYGAVTASLGDADVIVRPDAADLTPEEVTELTSLEEVGAAEGILQVFAQVRADGKQESALLTPMAASQVLDPYEWVSGTAPAEDDEVALTESTATRLGAELGDEVRIEREVLSSDDSWVSEGDDLVLSGIIADPPAIVAPLSTVMVSRANVEAWYAEVQPGTVVTYDSVLVAAADGSTPNELAETLRAAVPGTTVLTAEEEALSQTEALTGSTESLTALVLGFATVAMFVAAIVIANTFQVLVAQRARTLALLRCVGATKSQVHRSVLLEAVVLGLLASVTGLAAGLGLGQLALLFLQGADLGISVPATISLTPAVVAVPLLTGTAVTLLAALGPARAATRVAPIGALRPAADPGTRAGGGRLRLWSAALLTVAGAALLAGAVGTILIPDDSDGLVMLALAVGILGGMLSFAGVMVGAVFVVPQIVRGVGAAAAAVSRRGRPTVRLASVNARRNPRRTSATATALVIGVALVTLMATGAGSARASLDAALDSSFPVDVMVGSGEQELTEAQIAAVGAVEDIAGTSAVRTTRATVGDGDSAVEVEVVGLAPAAREVLRDADLVSGLADDTVIMGAGLAGAADVVDGDRVAIAGPDGQVELAVQVLPDGGWTTIVTPATTAVLDQDAAVTQVWARLAADVDAGSAIQSVQEAVVTASTDSAAPFVTGAAVEREGYTQIIDTLLAIVIGLLGVAVVIALIGVANTLSLSVIERRHEHALLRAVGMTRGQLRGTLVVEGLLIAAVGTGMGVALGLVYGWAAAAVLLGGSGGLTLVVPWAHLGAVAVVALVAGLAASVLPARSAVRTPPVAALAA